MRKSISSLRYALAMSVDGDLVRAEVHEGYDVFGIPHGGYLLALAGGAVLTRAGAPDLFTVTVHYLRKAAVGPMTFALTRVGGSRRFATWQVTASQDDTPVLTGLASVGDRETLDGPSWTDRTPWAPTEQDLGPPPGDPSLPLQPPAVAARVGMRLSRTTSGFATGRTGDAARVLAHLATGDDVDQLSALVAADITPPAVWNAIPPSGWVPTVELTAHVRARPAPGPLTVEADTHHVGGGFLEEDALVRDATGALVVQSRQLARTTA